MNQIETPDNSQMHLSRFLFVITIHRRLRAEILKDIFSGNLNRLRPKVVLFFDLLKVDRQLKRTIRDLADLLYDEEFGSLPSIERRLFACERAIRSDIEWMDQQEEMGLEWENLRF